MSRRRRLLDDPEEPDDPDEDSEESDDEPVEYLVLDEDDESVFTSVPKPAQESQTCISAPSIFTVLGDEVSAPHISHCGMRGPLPRRRLNGPTRPPTGRPAQAPSNARIA
jgi:hypothetical protein